MKECSKILEKHVSKHGFFNAKKEANREYYYDKDSWSVIVKLSTTAKIKSLLMLPVVIPIVPIVAVVWMLAGLTEVFTWLTAKTDDVLQIDMFDNESPCGCFNEYSPKEEGD